MSTKCIKRSSLAPVGTRTTKLPDVMLYEGVPKKVCPQAIENFGCSCHACSSPMDDAAVATSAYIPCCRMDPGSKKVICRSMDATPQCSCESCGVFIDAESPLVLCCNRHQYHTLLKRTEMQTPTNEARIRGMQA